MFYVKMKSIFENHLRLLKIIIIVYEYFSWIKVMIRDTRFKVFFIYAGISSHRWTWIDKVIKIFNPRVHRRILQFFFFKLVIPNIETKIPVIPTRDVYTDNFCRQQLIRIKCKQKIIIAANDYHNDNNTRCKPWL